MKIMIIIVDLFIFCFVAPLRLLKEKKPILDKSLRIRHCKQRVTTYNVIRHKII